MRTTRGSAVDTVGEQGGGVEGGIYAVINGNKQPQFQKLQNKFLGRGLASWGVGVPGATMAIRSKSENARRRLSCLIVQSLGPPADIDLRDLRRALVHLRRLVVCGVGTLRFDVV